MELDLMSPEETNRLNELETAIEDHMMGFLITAMALREIYYKKLFNGKYATWEIYLRKRWDIGKSYADYLIKAYDVIENLKQTSTIVEVLPKNEAQVRPLTLLPPEQQPEAWKKAVARSGGKVTALAVMKVVLEILEAKKDEEKGGIQKQIIKEVTVPDDFSNQLTKLIEILSLYRKAGWKNFNRKKALEFVNAIEQYLKS